MKNILPVFILFIFSTLGIAQDSSFEIQFKSGNFTSDKTIDFKEAIKPQAKEKHQKYIYRIVQFNTIPTVAEKQSIQNAGIDLLSFISNKAYIAKIERGLPSAAIEGLNIRSLTEVKDHLKLSPHLTKNELPEWAMNDGMIELNVKYYSSADKRSVIESIINNNGTVTFQLDKAKALSIQCNPDEIDALANNPLVQWIEPISPPGESEGTFARNTMRSNAINTSYIGGRKYDGTGVVVGLSDDGLIGPHIDTKGRVTLRTDETSGVHADLTSGIFIGAGNLDPSAVGTASGAHIHVFKHIPNGSLESHPHIVAGVENMEDHGLVVTSTSWSQDNGGVYTISSEFGDQQIYENQNIMHVLSAGNSGDRDHGYGAGIGWANITGGYKAGKNVICVGNITPSGLLATNSGRGPADDGRIKPDICAQGDGTLTTNKNNTYQIGGGTSAAAPAVAGVFTQLYQAYKELNGGAEPETALLKAAILNTAVDRGNPGPDFKFGWGQINGLKAVRVLEDKRYIRDMIAQAESKSHSITVPENVAKVKIMTYWTEPGGNPSASVSLVNDIDMQVLTPSEVTHNPWVLDPTPNPTNLNRTAIEGVDRLNNVEQVTLDNPQAGDYIVNLSGFDIPLGPQVFYIVYEFVYNDVELTYPIGGEGFVPGEVETIRWDASVGSDNIELEYSIDGGISYTSISDNIEPSALGFNWTVPNEISGNVKLRITRGDQQDESDKSFTIAQVPQALNILSVCPDGIEIEWDPIPGVTMYEISLLGDKFMDSIGVSTTNSFNVEGLNINDAHWFSVRSLISEGKGRRAFAINQPGGTDNCNLTDDITINEILNNPDDISTPCSDLEDIVVSIVLSNTGSEPQSNFELLYQLNNGDVVTEIFPETLMPGDEAIYNFESTFSIPTTDEYTLSVTANLAEDQNEFNDVATLNFFVSKSGTELNFEENFEENGITPLGWSIINNDNEITWTEATGIIGSDGNPTTVAYLNNWAYNAVGVEDILTTEFFDLTDVVGGAALSFDVAKSQWNPDLNDGLRIEVSIDCGESFITVYEKEDLELSTLPGYNNDEPWEPTNASQWRNDVIDLTPYLGETVLFRFININGFGNSIYIDNIGLSQFLVSTTETTIDKFELFPNPATEKIHLTLSSEVATDASVMIFNNLGQEVSQQNLEGNTDTIIDVSDYAAGIYFVTLTSNGIKETKKLIIE